MDLEQGINIFWIRKDTFNDWMDDWIARGFLISYTLLTTIMIYPTGTAPESRAHEMSQGRLATSQDAHQSLP